MLSPVMHAESSFACFPACSTCDGAMKLQGCDEVARVQLWTGCITLNTISQQYLYRNTCTRAGVNFLFMMLRRLCKLVPLSPQSALLLLQQSSRVLRVTELRFVSCRVPIPIV